MDVLQASFLLPGPAFLVEMVVFLVFVVGLVLVPLVQSVLLRQWVWTIFIVFLGPLAGLAWFTRVRTAEA